MATFKKLGPADVLHFCILNNSGWSGEQEENQHHCEVLFYTSG